MLRALPIPLPQMGVEHVTFLYMPSPLSSARQTNQALTDVKAMPVAQLRHRVSEGLAGTTY